MLSLEWHPEDGEVAGPSPSGCVIDLRVGKETMKIALIGGAGFLGTYLARAYLNAGHTVVVVDNLVQATHNLLDARARLYSLDARDSAVRSVLMAERPDIVSYLLQYRSEPLAIPNLSATPTYISVVS